MADVHVSPHRSIPQMSGGVLRGGRFAQTNATMLDLVSTAYGVDADRILGGPSWLETDRFDVIAKAPAGATPETAKIMLQNLLADRFKLTVRQDTKSVSSYVLTAGKGAPKLKQASGPAELGCQNQPPNPPPAPGTPPLYIVLACRNMTMTRFTELLHQVVSQPVVDSTKLEGSWDFDLKLTPSQILKSTTADGISIFDAVDQQMGLKLELHSVDLPVIIVDKVNQKPTDNLPGIGQALPAAPTEFEVADIKPSPAGATNQSGGFQPGGRIDVRAFPLKQLFQLAWEIPSNIGTDLIVGAPKWMDTDRFDIVAKAPSTGPTSANTPPVDYDTLVAMLRSLLTDRFKIVTHKEDQPVTVYALIVPKGEPKLKKADESDRAGCKQSPGPANPNGTPTILWTCKNTTMAYLAENLALWAPAYIDHPIIDATGLQGGWNFALNWTGKGNLNGPAQPTSGAGGAAAALDPGGLSAFEAVEKQLGLKLEVQKHAIPVTVIDKMEKLP